MGSCWKSVERVLLDMNGKQWGVWIWLDEYLLVTLDDGAVLMEDRKVVYNLPVFYSVK